MTEEPSPEQRPNPPVIGLPEDFVITNAEAQALEVDLIVADSSLENDIFGAYAALGRARIAATERNDRATARALQLLVVVAGFGPCDDARRAFGALGSGTYADGSPWRCAIPDDLSEAQITALTVLFGTISSSVLRARIADVLWNRARPRNITFAREAIAAYLAVAEETFDPEHWITPHRHLSRAFALAALLGPLSAERADVVGKAFVFLDRLEGQDPLYFTQQIIALLIPVVSEPAELQRLLTRAQPIAEGSADAGDFDRARAYYDVAIPLARRLKRDQEARAITLARAETHVTESLRRPTELLRSMDLRLAMQSLRDAGATRERRDEVDRLLAEAQAVSVTEMATLSTPLESGDLPRLTRESLRGQEPITGLWLLAGIVRPPTVDSLRTNAERLLERNRFAFGFAQPHLSRDGRREGETPGALGADEDTYQLAIEGAMRFNAAYSRISAVFGVIEPGRQELIASHDYTLAQIHVTLQSRPFIPNGHSILWSKGVHAGLVGDFDIAVHLLAPQLEHALRELLRRHGEAWYSTSPTGVQSVLSLETVLVRLRETGILSSDVIFSVSSVLAERLGANVRNEVAHGLVSDIAASSHDSIYVWWLALHLLRFYGMDPSVEGTAIRQN